MFLFHDILVLPLSVDDVAMLLMVVWLFTSQPIVPYSIALVVRITLVSVHTFYNILLLLQGNSNKYRETVNAASKQWMLQKFRKSHRVPEVSNHRPRI